MAKHCNLEANEFIHFLGNAHIYDDHIDSLNKQLENEIFWPPKLYIKNKYENIEDYKLNDFIIKNYKCHNTIKMKMRP